MLTIHELQIEDAIIHDAEEILELQKNAFLGQAKIYNNYHLPPLVQSLESIKLEFASKIFLKAVINNQIIASVKYQLQKDVVNIDRLIVDPEFQNLGVGTYLMKTVENRFSDCVHFHLFTGEKSIRNIHLYTKLGYQAVKRETSNQGVVLVHMVKTP